MILTHNHQDTARGSSQQREEPQQGTSAERWWEDHGSSPGSPGLRTDLPPEEVGLDAEEEPHEPYFEEEDHAQEEAAALWVTEDQLEDDYLQQTLESCRSWCHLLKTGRWKFRPELQV